MAKLQRRLAFILHAYQTKAMSFLKLKCYSVYVDALDVNAQRQKKQAKTKVIDTSSEPRESTKNLDTNSQRKKRVSFEEDVC